MIKIRNKLSQITYRISTVKKVTVYSDGGVAGFFIQYS